MTKEPIAINPLFEKTFNKIKDSYAFNTVRAYKSDFLDFHKYCEELSLGSLPADPELISQYIHYCIEHQYSFNTIKRKAASISTMHRFNRFPDPIADIEVKLAIRKANRVIERSVKQAYGISKDLFQKMVDSTGEDLRGYRDRALLYLSFYSLCRRLELSKLLIEDIKHNEDKSALIFIRESKTDLRRTGRLVYLPDHVWFHVEAWLIQAKLTEGPILRGIVRNQVSSSKLSPGTINRILKKLAKRIQLKSEIVAKISSHSTRVGAAQELLYAGSTLLQVMQRGGWSATKSVLRYVTHADALFDYSRFKNNVFD